MLRTLVETETMHKNRWITQLEIETVQTGENEILKCQNNKKTEEGEESAHWAVECAGHSWELTSAWAEGHGDRYPHT